VTTKFVLFFDVSDTPKVEPNKWSGSEEDVVLCRLTEMTFNNMMRMISGKRYYGDDGDVTDAEEAKQFRDIISEVMSLLGANNKGDFLPLLRWFDFDGLEKRLKSISRRADAFLQGLLEEHRSGKHKANTMIEHLLTMQESQPEYYSDHIIKGLIQVTTTIIQSIQSNISNSDSVPHHKINK